MGDLERALERVNADPADYAAYERMREAVQSVKEDIDIQIEDGDGYHATVADFVITECVLNQKLHGLMRHPNDDDVVATALDLYRQTCNRLARDGAYLARRGTRLQRENKQLRLRIEDLCKEMSEKDTTP